MAMNVRSYGKTNRYEGHCQFCGKSLAPGQGKLWKFAGRWRCACLGGCRNSVAPETIRARIVDAVDRDGCVVNALLMPDGSVILGRR